MAGLRNASSVLVTLKAKNKDGLQKLFQVMIDKVLTVKTEKIGLTIGRVNADLLVEIKRFLAVFLGVVNRHQRSLPL